MYHKFGMQMIFQIVKQLIREPNESIPNDVSMSFSHVLISVNKCFECFCKKKKKYCKE